MAKPWLGYNPDNAFTLIELIVVIALMGAVLSIAMPKFQAAFEVGNLDQAIRAVSANVQKIKKAATKSNKAMYMVIDLDRKRIRQGKPPDTDGLFPESEDDDEGGYKIHENVTIMDVQWPDGETQTQGQAYIRFSPEGYIQYAAIHLEDNDRQVTLFLETFLGQVRMQEGYIVLGPE